MIWRETPRQALENVWHIIGILTLINIYHSRHIFFKEVHVKQFEFLTTEAEGGSTA